MQTLDKKLEEAAECLINSEYSIVFTGAGISVESGIPPFRGPDGLWSKYNPSILNLNRFLKKPEESWPVIKEIFYDFYGAAKPNPAHTSVAELEKMNIVKRVITQNIDDLHQKGGSSEVYEFHGTMKSLKCLLCNKSFDYAPKLLKKLPALCPNCGGLLKPDFVFFGEGIPQYAYKKSIEGAKNSDCVLVIGTTGEIQPASYVPIAAADKGAKIIEINIEDSKYTNFITDIFLKGKAGEIMPKLLAKVKSMKK